MEYIGFLLALIIGIVLGLLGGGGSILAVPVLAYLFMLDEKVSTAYSLFIVGISALVGGIKQHKSGLVDWKTAIIFGIPAVIGVWVTRHLVVPQLPDILFEVSSFEFTRRMGMFGLFSLLMFWAAFSMLQVKLIIPVVILATLTMPAVPAVAIATTAAPSRRLERQRRWQSGERERA